MRRTLIALASLGALCSVAHAQSSVTLYGLIDVGMAFNNNAGGHKQYFMSSGNINGSRWGLQGSEDLGGGLKALFRLENGYSLNTGALGQGGSEFGRQAYVGLASATYGTVLAGRQYDSGSDFTGGFGVSDQWAAYFGAHPGDLDNMNQSFRVNNALKYLSPTYAGFSYGALYSFGGKAGDFHQNQIWSIGGKYKFGPFSAGIAYVNNSDPNFSSFGNNPSSSTTASNMTSSKVYSGYASAKTQAILTSGAAYQIGKATIGITYSNVQFKDVGSEVGIATPSGRGTAKFNDIELNAKYYLTPDFMIGAAYNWLKGYDLNHATYHQGVIGAVYNFSKRTDVYVSGLYQHASGTDSTGNRAVANLNYFTASSTANQLGVVVGMRHRF